MSFPVNSVASEARLIQLLLPLVGVGVALLVWWAASAAVSDLPSPLRTWEESKIYVLEPLEKRGEMRPGHRAARVLQPDARRPRGSCSASRSRRRSASCSGMSKTLTRMFDPVMQVMRPISPLAWLPLGLISVQEVRAGGALRDRRVLDVADRHQHDGRRARHPAGLLERRAESCASRR